VNSGSLDRFPTKYSVRRRIYYCLWGSRVADTVSKRRRSWLMGRVKSKNTTPERLVRSFLHRNGFRFRLHARTLPGKPDVVLARHRTVVFVNGCFWHGHAGCKRATMPTTRPAFWRQKIEATIARDKRMRRELLKLGWKVITVWGCQAVRPECLERDLALLLHSGSN
jgi:DNA mismatch endonuclease, patch repair protein